MRRRDDCKDLENGDNPIDLYYIHLNDEQEMSQMKQSYLLPFMPSKDDSKEFIIFKNASEFELIGAKPVDLDYNINHNAFKLQIQFRAKLYECFENNDNQFPFEK